MVPIVRQQANQPKIRNRGMFKNYSKSTESVGDGTERRSVTGFEYEVTRLRAQMLLLPVDKGYKLVQGVFGDKDTYMKTLMEPLDTSSSSSQS